MGLLFKILLIGVFALTGAMPLVGQVVISGKVLDGKSKPLAGASVFVENTLDGTTSDSTGFFKLVTAASGTHHIIGTLIGFETSSTTVQINGSLSGLVIKMRTVYSSLDKVVISAGAFMASDNGKTILKPMDIMTTAGASADVVRAIETLPGTQQPGSSTGLFVRGGDASETAVVVDGMLVQNAFLSNVPGVSQSSRFSPFQFKGISFSSGGYSARYGQALSSVLELNTTDLPDKSRISIGANVTGIFGAGIKVWKKSSLELAGAYNNFSPFYGLANSNIKYYHPPDGNGVSAKFVFVPHPEEILKISLRYSLYKAGLKTPDPFIAGDTTHFDINNSTFFSGMSWQRQYKNKWLFYAAASYSYNRDNIRWSDSALGSVPEAKKDFRGQLRMEGKKYLSNDLTLVGGAELQRYGYTRDFDTLTGIFSETIAAAYVEANWYPFSLLALRPGIRYEHSALLEERIWEPRISLVVRTGQYSQVAMAGGLFYQDPENRYLLSGYRPFMQEAVHYILDVQWMREERVFRMEVYYKDYKGLAREYAASYDPNDFRFIPAGIKVDNSGYGYAKGLEIFWHDKKTIKGFDYWLSYSYIDTKRFYENYLREATPDFIASHNLNLVTKYFVEKWNTSFSVTGSYASGRPYYDPAGKVFLGDRTPEFENVALGVGHLTHIKKWFTVIYAGIDNLLNHPNIFGYRYSYDGVRRFPILPALYRSFLIGMNISLSQFDKSEL